ncbi:MAG: NnrU family protein [Proteobacteria bacterium]|nr:NnrU family protein [Pseudomonadota bacterium]
MTTLIIGLLVFLGIHSFSIFAATGRNAMVARMGALPWKALYALVAIIGFVLIVKGYAAARLEPVLLYVPPVWTRHLAALLMLPAFILLFAAYLPGRIKTAMKHPMLVAVKLWAVAHLLANGMLADVVLFGALLVWAVVDRISLKSRAPNSAPPPSAPPSKFNDLIAVVGGLVLYGVFAFYLHARWIGVAPFG